MFLGRVVSVRRPSATNGTTTIRVTAAWRGGVRGAVVIHVDPTSPMCSFDFERGETYLVYADRAGGRLVASGCSRTTPWRRSRRDLDALGAPTFGRLPRVLPEPNTISAMPF